MNTNWQFIVTFVIEITNEITYTSAFLYDKHIELSYL